MLRVFINFIMIKIFEAKDTKYNALIEMLKNNIFFIQLVNLLTFVE